MNSLILVVEDDPDVRDLLVMALTAGGYTTLAAKDGPQALAMQDQHPVDLVLLDVGLGAMDGFQVCSAIRARSRVPIMFITGRADEVDQLVGLSTGADDYLVKPVSSRVLVAKVKAMLRRTVLAAPTGSRLSAGPLSMDLDARTVTAGGQGLDLTRIEFDILALLMADPNKVVTRSTIFDKVWESFYGDSHLVEVHMSRLRRKIRLACGVRTCEAVRGVGYRLGSTTA